MTRASAVLLVAVAACSSDVLLGGRADAGSDADSDAGSDASSDASDAATLDAAVTTPFANGDYALTIAATQSMIMCTGTLAGMESAFASVTRDSVGLVSGTVTVTGVDATNIDVGGPPIETGFAMTPVRLTKGGGPGVPPDVWIGVGTRVGSGPAGTSLVAVELEAHELTVTAMGFDGRVGVLYVDLASSDQCVVGFDVTYRH